MKIKFSVWLSIMFLIASTGFFTTRCNAFSNSYSLSIRNAEDMLSRGDYLKALGRFNYIASNTKSRELKARALFFIAETINLYFDQQETALNKFKEIIKNYPDTKAASDALFNTGIILFDKGSYKKAHELFLSYMEKYPKGMRMASAKVWADIAKPLTDRKPPAKPESIQTRKKLTCDQNPLVKILIKKNKKKLVFSAEKSISISREGKKLYYFGWGPLVFSRHGKNLLVNGHKLPVSSCWISSSSLTIRVDNVPYRGFFNVFLTGRGISAVNHLSLENYLYSVIPNEMPDSWPTQALMAQAVAARTYALYFKSREQGRKYDLEATTASQVYGGFSSESISARQAVDTTKGQVMTYDRKLIIAYFHSCSGGFTEDPANVWNTKLPYLKGIPDSFSNNTPDENWMYFLSFREARTKLNQYGFNIGRLYELKPCGISRSGRNLSVKAISDKGSVKIACSYFRSIIGEERIKSTLFRTTPASGGVIFRGKGSGHGVGMSQWGAMHMARSGYNYKDILRHYYKNIQFVKMKG